LILSGNTLYGTAARNGGAVFALNTDGTGFTNIGGSSSSASELLLAGNTLYAASVGGGSGGNGTVFALNTNGTGFTTLYNFTAISYDSFPYYNSDGARPYAGLVLLGNTLYGTANYLGNLGGGTLFSLSFAPQLTITRSGANVVLTWPTNVAGLDYTGFTLQSTTNLVSPTDWSTNSPTPVVVNGQNTVTNPASGAQKFFRLRSQ
jgi:uncharacterized repeat protein (TIGR03803 family)